jgi:acyl-CoA synthetase (AMP-forming)/AMP-acid ligase II
VLLSPNAFARRPIQFLALAAAHRVQYCSMPNFGYEWILKRLSGKQRPDLDLSHLKALGVGAEPVNTRAMQSFATALKRYGLRANVLSPCYGLAESTLAVTLPRPGEGYALSSYGGESYVTCGRLLDGMEIKLGAGGRILIRGESVARTALIDGVVTTIVDDQGYYDTKDIGHWHEDALVVRGRADEMFIVNGENYFPYDIENAVRGVKDVRKNRAVCFQCPPADGQPARIVVLYESLPQTAAQEARMAESISRAVLACTGLPVQEIVPVAPRSIPVTPSGKLQRLRARQLYLDGFYRDKAGDAESQKTGPHNMALEDMEQAS